MKRQNCILLNHRREITAIIIGLYINVLNLRKAGYYIRLTKPETSIRWKEPKFIV